MKIISNRRRMKTPTITIGDRVYTMRHVGYTTRGRTWDTLSYNSWDIRLNGVKVGLVSDLAFNGRFSASMNPLRWMGAHSKDLHDHNWHDCGPTDTLEQSLRAFVQRAEKMHEFRGGWRAPKAA
jgi:hypothetical protein